VLLQRLPPKFGKCVLLDPGEVPTREACAGRVRGRTPRVSGGAAGGGRALETPRSTSPALLTAGRALLCAVGFGASRGCALGVLLSAPG
jgi:hypothetical protein